VVYTRTTTVRQKLIAEDARDTVRAVTPSATTRATSARARAARALPVAIPTCVLAYLAIAGIYRKLGHPGATLDDSFIHFQYARSLAELHPFRYQAGEPFTTGATSFLWPALLAPFYAMGFRDVSILWPAWVLSFAALGFLAHEAAELTRPLAGRTAAVGAAAMVLAFSGFSWCAASGMEVVPFAWVLARAARRASEWAEARPGDAGLRTAGRRNELLALALVAPLVRPEGAIASWMVAATLLAFPRTPKLGERALGAIALAAPMVPFALAFALTGHLRSSTTTVKLMLGNPYYSAGVLVAAVTQNARVLVGTLLNGEIWSAEFLPKGGASVAMAGLVAIPLRGWQARARWRAACVLGLALGMFVPCVYVTFLWNRLRYLWPFATGWLIGLACLARVLGDALGRVRERWRVATPLACGAIVGVLAIHQGWTLDDVADSASGIDRQQVRLGRWARENLPQDARIGVNDTGAIAYLSDRHTFDIVGLTTRDEGRYWVAGAASRFEHYERMRAWSPQLLPTHFIVYPEWMGCPMLLGSSPFEATVTDSTILGGTTMGVYEADYATLGSGEAPWTAAGKVLDDLDVADLESEAAHGYDLMGTGDGLEVLRDGLGAAGERVVDGGRSGRRVERFLVSLGGRRSHALVRLESARPTHVQVYVNGKDTVTFDTKGGEWEEDAFAVPEVGGSGERASFELRSSESLTVYHYWFTDGVP